METLQAMVIFTVTTMSIEIGILLWARAVLTSKKSTKALHVLVFESPYRFLWLPKLTCALLLIIVFTFVFQIDSVDVRTKFGIAGLFLLPIFGCLVTYEAIRTRE